MLWEHNSTIIVMLTKLREMGRVRPLTSHELVILLISFHFFFAQDISLYPTLTTINKFESDYCTLTDGHLGGDGIPDQWLN